MFLINFYFKLRRGGGLAVSENIGLNFGHNTTSIVMY